MPSSHIVIKGTTEVLESDVPAFIRSVIAVAAETVKEPGCIYYHNGRDLVQSNLFQLSEAWIDQAALDAHLESPHFKQVMRDMSELTLTSVDLKRYHVVNEEDLSHLVPRK